MKNLIVNVSRKTRMVSLPEEFISVDGENLQSNLVFKFTDEFVDGQARLEYKSGGTKNYIVLTENNEEYSTPVKNVITKEGRIEMQLVITEGNDSEEIPVFKSNVFYLYCNRSINAVNEAPEGYDLWIDVANEKLNEMDNIDIDIQTVGDNTEVIITRKDGTTKEAIVSGGGSVTDVKQNGTSVVVNGVANVTVPTSTSDLTNNSNFVSDSNYVHTDNNYTTNEKTKLANLSNYDDTEVRELINDVADDIPTKTSDLTNDSGFITTETDPVFSSSPASEITSSDISNWNGKQDKLTSANAGTNVTITEVGGVVKINSAGGGSGTSDYDQLSNRPSINNVTLTGNKSLNDLGIINFSGDYTDLTNKPIIPTDTSDLTNGAGFITGINSTDVTNALGYTPYSSSNPNGYTSNTGTITGITMNGTSKGTSGVVDLGTVITEHQDISGKVDKEAGKGLSTNDYTTQEKQKLAAIDMSTKQDVIDSTHKLNADLVDDTSTTNKFVTASDKTAWNGKVDKEAHRNYNNVDSTSIITNYGNYISMHSGDDNSWKGSNIYSGTDSAYIEHYDASQNQTGAILINDSGTSISGVVTPTNNGDATNKSYVDTAVGSKQDTLVSGTNIKTINNTSLLGSGNITIQGGSGSPEVHIGNDAPTGDEVIWIDTDESDITLADLAGDSTHRLVTDTEKSTWNGKQDATTITTSASTTVTQEIANNNEYRYTGNVSSLTITLPSSISDDFISWVVFNSGSTATSIVYPNTIKWSGDDVSSNTFVPVASKTYNVCFWYDGINVNAITRGV